MENTSAIKERVHEYYWQYDFNCATTMLKILAELFEIEILPQTYDAVVAIPGAGRYGAQCGLVSGAIMFIGISGRLKNLTNEAIDKGCYDFTDGFKREFHYLNCSELRPEGFKPENPPHLCENLTARAVDFAVEYVRRLNWS